MSILEMTYVSYFLTIIAVLSGITAVILYFAYDIRRCWQIVRGGSVREPITKVPVNRQKGHLEKTMRHDRAWNPARQEKTEPLCMNACETTLLCNNEETRPLETMYLLQDITMMDVQS